MSELTAEEHRQLNFLAALPHGSTTVERKSLKAIMLQTGGTLMSGGRLFTIQSKHLGAGVYKLTLKDWKP